MSLQVIPALDVAGGRLVRMDAAGPTEVEAFDGDPVAAAHAFASAGAQRLHLVDVDLAMTGDARALGVLEAVAALGVPVQASGGVRSATHVEALLEAGASRVVLGSGALASRLLTEELVSRFGPSLAVGIEADGDRILPRSGGEAIHLWDTMAWLDRLEVTAYVLTQVGRVGGLGGPDLAGVRGFASRTRRALIVAGGLRGIQDLRAVAGVGPPVEGAILGRALYEGLDLAEVLGARLGEGP